MIKIAWGLIILQIPFICVYLWGILVTIAGIIKKKKHTYEQNPNINKKHMFAILICARDEEKVISGLLESIAKQSYEPAYYDVFLVADHCTDKTVEKASDYSFVKILERTEKGKEGKGAALEWALNIIREKYKGKYEVYTVIDADNRLNSDFLEKTNNGLCKGMSIITGNRVSRNPYQTVISQCYTVYWSIVIKLFYKSRMNLGLSAFLSGTGFTFRDKLLDNEGWKTVTMAEDIEFSVQQNLKGNSVAYLEEATFYDEQPTKFIDAYHQLRRWATGSCQTVKKYGGKCLKAFFIHPTLRVFDCGITVLMCCCTGIVFLLNVMCILLLLFQPIKIILYIMTAAGLITVFAAYSLSVWSICMSEFSVKRIWAGILFFPIFMLVLSVCCILALIRPQRHWTKIEHMGETI